MYEEAIVLGLGMSSIIFAYIASQLNSDKSGILKLIFLSASAINTYILINVCAKIGEQNGVNGLVLANMIWTNSSVLYLVTLYASLLWLGVLLILWVLQQLFNMTHQGKVPTQ